MQCSKGISSEVPSAPDRAWNRHGDFHFRLRCPGLRRFHGKLQALRRGRWRSPGLSGVFPFLWLNAGRAEALSERVGEKGERDEIETDRDSFTPATKLAGIGRIIMESAYSFIENRGVASTHSYPELLFRYGLTDRLELRLGWNTRLAVLGTGFLAPTPVKMTRSTGEGLNAKAESITA